MRLFHVKHFGNQSFILSRWWPIFPPFPASGGPSPGRRGATRRPRSRSPAGRIPQSALRFAPGRLGNPAGLRPPVPLRGPAVPPRRVPRGLGRGRFAPAPFSASLRPVRGSPDPPFASLRAEREAPGLPSASLRPAPRGPLRSLRARRRPPAGLFAIFLVYADFLLTSLLKISV